MKHGFSFFRSNYAIRKLNYHARYYVVDFENRFKFLEVRAKKTKTRVSYSTTLNQTTAVNYFGIIFDAFRAETFGKDLAQYKILIK